MLIWIFFWWLLGVIVLGYLMYLDRGYVISRRVDVGHILATIALPLIWPVIAVMMTCEDLVNLPVFDLDWFRRNHD